MIDVANALRSAWETSGALWEDMPVYGSFGSLFEPENLGDLDGFWSAFRNQSTRSPEAEEERSIFRNESGSLLGETPGDGHTQPLFPLGLVV